MNLSVLVTFKYFNFLSESLSGLFTLVVQPTSFPLLDFLLPVGISFYTFQTTGYLIDIYNKKIKAEKRLGIFALYVIFFPQLVAGPIERAKNLMPQFHKKRVLMSSTQWSRERGYTPEEIT